MSNLSWDSNTWYSVQNFGSDWFLAAGNVNDGNGKITVAEASTSNDAVWQIGTSSGNHYLRSKGQGAKYCMQSNGGNLSLASCSSNSPVWSIATWNSRDTGDGNFFTSSSSDNDSRLYVDNAGDISMKAYSQTNSNQDIYYQWAISSVSAINDMAYSSFPSSGSESTSSSLSSSKSASSLSSASPSSSMSSGGNTTSSTSESATNLSSLLGLSSASSSNAEPSTSTNLVTVTGTVQSTAASASASATSTMIVTAAPSSSPSSSPTLPTGPASISVSGAGSNHDRMKPAVFILALGLGALLNGEFI